MEPIDVAEILYQVRGALETRQNPGMVKIRLTDVENLLKSYLHGVCLDPGVTTEDADELKLTLMAARRPELTETLPAPGRDTIARLLSEAADVTGSGDDFRELGRFHEFCMRARFPGMIHEDPVLPVKEWLGDRKIGDLEEAAETYLEWQEAACKKFKESPAPVLPPIEL